MDPELEQYVTGERGKPTLRLCLVVDGIVFIGSPSHPESWREHVNAYVDELDAEPGVDPMANQWLRVETAVDHDDDGYTTLRDASMIFANGQKVQLGAVRVDLEKVSAWFIRAPDNSAEAAKGKGFPTSRQW